MIVNCYQRRDYICANCGSMMRSRLENNWKPIPNMPKFLMIITCLRESCEMYNKNFMLKPEEFELVEQ